MKDSYVKRRVLIHAVNTQFSYRRRLDSATAFTKVFNYMHGYILKNYPFINIPDNSEINNLEIKDCIFKTCLKQGRKSGIPRSMENKTAVLFYELTKSNISKAKKVQLSIMITMFYLFRKNYWLKIKVSELIKLIQWIKLSEDTVREEVILALSKIFSKKIIRL